MDTQQFFSEASAGGRNWLPDRPWKPFFTEVPEEFNRVFSKYEGYFDQHIATSIPMYREMQLITGDLVVDMLKSKPNYPIVFDIAGSEGTWCKAISECSDGRIVTGVIDCNEEMHKSFERTGAPPQCHYRERPFLADFNGLPKYEPKNFGDIVHAGMAFQFMPFTREECIKEVKENYLRKDGLFLIEEKVVPDTPALWFQNETLKNEFKRMYYSQESLDRKQALVVNDMDANLVTREHLVSVLRKYFKHVKMYYHAGNFVGFACSDKESVLDPFKYLPLIKF
jgi:hypothetical protein